MVFSVDIVNKSVEKCKIVHAILWNNMCTDGGQVCILHIYPNYANLLIFLTIIYMLFVVDIIFSCTIYSFLKKQWHILICCNCIS